MLSSLALFASAALYWLGLILAVWVAASLVFLAVWCLACVWFQRRAAWRAGVARVERLVDGVLAGEDREAAR